MMGQHHDRRTPVRLFTLAAILVICALGSGWAVGQYIITEIINSNGDGVGNGLDHAVDIAVDAVGNVYVGGGASANAFKITPGGIITQIIDATGDMAHTRNGGPETAGRPPADELCMPSPKR